MPCRTWSDQIKRERTPPSRGAVLGASIPVASLSAYVPCNLPYAVNIDDHSMGSVQHVHKFRTRSPQVFFRPLLRRCCDLVALA
eukprot:7020675-Pyramimonas_sp.AAC.4